MLHLITGSGNNMINAKVKKFLDNNGLGDRLTEHSETADQLSDCREQPKQKQSFFSRLFNK